MNGITAVCSREENGQLTIPEALTLFAEKAAGETESELESRAADFRKANGTEAVSSRSVPSRPGAAIAVAFARFADAASGAQGLIAYFLIFS